MINKVDSDWWAQQLIYEMGAPQLHVSSNPAMDYIKSLVSCLDSWSLHIY